MKILLLRFSSIGDIVLTTPVARCLKQQLGAEVHYLTKEPFVPILTPNPNVDRVFSFKKAVTEVLPLLRAERYDWIIDLHHNLRTLRLKWALGRPARSFNKLNFEKWLLVNTGIDRLPDVHIVHRYPNTGASRVGASMRSR
jgi:ADP-heptose:LPS heptosyltransferase